MIDLTDPGTKYYFIPESLYDELRAWIVRAIEELEVAERQKRNPERNQLHARIAELEAEIAQSRRRARSDFIEEWESWKADTGTGDFTKARKQWACRALARALRSWRREMRLRHIAATSVVLDGVVIRPLWRAIKRELGLIK